MCSFTISITLSTNSYILEKQAPQLFVILRMRITLTLNIAKCEVVVFGNAGGSVDAPIGVW